ncbi:myristoylated alanine-rich C-kinase substrate isoform X1 [Fopius arisanus]|uniref:Myristoylated alanine-rich C-kinase substrate isoform X1 n=1 Tax=Fopius arisanus TaxID=64838 RepID=A0A9R1TTD4_9HYME|nr:PREDICTED: myristoylated alanine-rich C-kinase substrate isoform X1 [Fopius arisanus]XP_011314668.1 PREDICTED: myristoylated alanine-rich C-kinase substrate isoform X1 [Fopius arisanus]
MGARHSKRSMDVTTTPKKEGLPAEGGDAAPVGDGKLERIEEADVKPTTNGVGAHTEASEDKDVKDKDANTEKEEKKETKEDEEEKVEETKAETPGETPTEGGDATTPTEGTPASPTSATSPDTKESKKKEKTKKKWSFRTISFGRKDKTKPVREDAPKNGDVSKEEPLAEGGEEAETSPAEEKSTPASPTEPLPAAAEDSEQATPAAATDDKNEASSTPAPTPTPLEAPKDDDKVEKKTEEDRLADSNGDKMQCPLNYADIVKKDQSIAEPEAPVEKINEVTTEKIEEAPKSLPPSVPIEVSVPAAPVITEDVASVTKAIEEIDINEKAVAAAVNETIESVNTNEIIADMNHQNTLNE